MATQEASQYLRHNSTVLAFDFGEKRIGTAIGDMTIGIAHPLQTVSAESNDERFSAIARLVAEWQPVRLVVGLPAHTDGTEHELSRLCRKFAQRLHGRFNLPVTLVDERFSSVEASRTLHAMGRFGQRHKQVLDQVAAQTILQSFLDGQHAA